MPALITPYCIDETVITGTPGSPQEITYASLTDMNSGDALPAIMPENVTIKICPRVDHKFYLTEAPGYRSFKIARTGMQLMYTGDLTAAFIIYGGDPFGLPVWRIASPAEIIEIIHIDESTTVEKDVTGKDIIRARFMANRSFDFEIGDYVIYQGKYYYINTLPNAQKNATNNFVYDVLFERLYYDMAKVQLRNI